MLSVLLYPVYTAQVLKRMNSFQTLKSTASVPRAHEFKPYPVISKCSLEPPGL